MQRIEKLRGMLANAPEDIFLNFSLAMELMSVGAPGEARHQFEHTIELDPNYLPAYQRLAELLIKEKCFEEARTQLEAARPIAEEAGDQHMLDNIKDTLAMLP